MPSSVEISIPTTSTAPSPSPHTLYHITLRLPLRTFTLTKRYSDFASFHKDVVAQCADHAAPPVALPGKTLFGRTVNNPDLIEQRRAGLEAYLRAINDAPDPRWRGTAAWRTFLNLPAASSSSTSSTLHAAATAPDRPIADPVAWLDAHRELKAHVHAARSALASRDGTHASSSLADSFSNAAAANGTELPPSASSAHEAAAAAKKSLVRAAALITPLDQGLREHGTEWSRRQLGEGEVRRRKDLLAAARKEIDSLEHLASLVRRKGDVDGMVDGMHSSERPGGDPPGSRGGGGSSTYADPKSALLSGASARASSNSSISGGGGVSKGRVLGKETARTRELDNSGVLQLQQQIMAEQDTDLATLAQAVRRQRELGTQIQEELEVQNDLLTLLDDDVERVQGKVGVAKKRVNKIS